MDQIGKKKETQIVSEKRKKASTEFFSVEALKRKLHLVWSFYT